MINPFFQFLISTGVPEETIILLLLFPFVATMIVTLRQIVGIKAFGIYTPLIITFAFLETGLRYGAAIFVLSLFIATLFRFLLQQMRILYLPKMAIILSVTVLSMFLILLEGALSRRTVLISLSVLPILIIITLVEKFITAQIEKGYRQALFLSVETLIISSICYFILAFQPLRTFVFLNPLIVVPIFLFNIILGRWDGLRLMEYIRFRKVIAHLE